MSRSKVKTTIAVSTGVLGAYYMAFSWLVGKGISPFTNHAKY